jgi:hypothetical protein
MIRIVGLLGILPLLFPASALAGEGDPDQTEVIRELREEIRALRERVSELEGRAAEEQLEVLGTAGIDAAIEEYVSHSVTAPRSLRIAITGQVRVQGEDHLDSDFDDDEGDALEFVRLRTRVMFDATVLEWLRALVKIQDSRSFGEEHGVLGDLEGVDLKEGFVDIRGLFGVECLDFRIGRQEMKYGNQRLISTLDWHPVGRSWDGFRLMYDGDRFHTHLFITRIDERFLVGGQDESEDFLGLYGWWDVAEKHVLDLYVLFRRNQDADDIVGEDGAGGDESLWTLGARFEGALDGFDYVAEAAFQTGDFANDDVSAFMFEAGLGYTFSDWPGKPRIGASWVYASGDDDPTDGDRETFDPLYTFGHFYLGYMDFVNRQNVSSPKLSLSLVPAEGVTVRLDGHMFWVDESEDALYALSGKPSRSGDPEADDYVGAEIDLHVKIKVDANLTVWFGYSHFFTGEFLDDTGPDDDADFLFLQLTMDF